MLRDIKKASKHSFVYAVGNISNKLVGLILLPMYTNAKYFTQAEFGALAILEATCTVMMGVMAFAMTTSLNRWYWDKKYITKQKSIFFTSFSTLLLINIPILLMLLINAQYLSGLIFRSHDYTYLLKLTFISAVIRLINRQITSVIQLQSKSLLYTGLQILQFLITMLLTLVAVIKMGKGLDGIWEAALIGDCFAFLIMLPFLIKNISFHFEWKILQEMFGYGLPIMFGTLAVTILNLMDRYMLNFISGLESAGLYSLGLRIANILQVVVITSISSAVSPLLMKKMDEANNQRFYSKLMTYEAFIYIIGILGVSFFSLEVIKLITKTQGFWEAAMIIPILSFNVVAARIASLCSIGLQIKKRTKVMSMIVVISMIVNFALNYLLIPRWDIYGAAIATLLTQFLSSCVTIYYAHKYYRINYEFRKLLLMLVIAVFYITFAISLSEWVLWIRLVLKTILFISFPVVLYLFRFYEDIELKSIKNIFSSWKNPRKIKKSFNRLLQN